MEGKRGSLDDCDDDTTPSQNREEKVLNGMEIYHATEHNTSNRNYFASNFRKDELPLSSASRILEKKFDV